MPGPPPNSGPNPPRGPPFPRMRMEGNNNLPRNMRPDFDPRIQWPNPRGGVGPGRGGCPGNGGPRFPSPGPLNLPPLGKDGAFCIKRDPVGASSDLESDKRPRCAISPDRRTNFSFDSSYASDSASSRTDTDSSNRGTPLPWEAGNPRPPVPPTGRGYPQRPSSSRYAQPDPGHPEGGDCARDRVYNQDGSTWRKPGDEPSAIRRDGDGWGSTRPGGGGEGEKHGTKRHWDDNHDSDSEWTERSV
jgi:hypothetical protein